MHKRIISLGTIMITFALFAVSAWLLFNPRWSYEVSVGGMPVGVVDSLDEYQQIVEDIQSKAENQWGCDLIMNEEVTATRIRQWSSQSSPALVCSNIEDIATYQTRGWAIIVNGATLAIVDHEQTAHDIIEEVKARYVSKKHNCSLVSASVQEAVGFEARAVAPEALMGRDEVLALLTCGHEESSAYVVRGGDTLSGIARSHSIPVAALREANGISGDLIQVGQVLNLKANKALLHVKTVEELSVTETISRGIVYKINPDKSVRADKVTNAGWDGVRAVTYQVVKINGNEISRKQIASKVTKEPQAKIVLTGIGQWPARPTGMFRFPVNEGKITSLFGAPRSNGPHLGLDIANPRGTPVYAAASGTVTAKTRGLTYGLYISIEHADGYSTRYAHLNSFASNVRVGGKIVRGQLIGYVGNTGRSTGSHLHWEVRRYGQALNPLKFFAN